eukprot:Nk52_evm30s295 gene=Nk52_evmTU30s295
MKVLISYSTVGQLLAASGSLILCAVLCRDSTVIGLVTITCSAVLAGVGANIYLLCRCLHRRPSDAGGGAVPQKAQFRQSGSLSGGAPILTSTGVLVSWRRYEGSVISEEADNAISLVVQRLLFDYVHVWYDGISDDNDVFVVELMNNVKFAAFQLIRRAMVVDWAEVATTDLLRTVACHLDCYLRVRMKYGADQSGTWLSKDKFIGQVLQQLEDGGHCALRSKEMEAEYLRNTAEVLIADLCAPLPSAALDLTREVVSGCLFQLMVDTFTDPGFLYNVIIQIFMLTGFDPEHPDDALIFPEEQPLNLPDGFGAKKVNILSRFGGIPGENCPSAFHVALPDILNSSSMLFYFMKYLETMSALPILNFCFTVETYNELAVMTKDRRELEKLRDKAEEIFETYAESASPDYIDVEERIIERMRAGIGCSDLLSGNSFIDGSCFKEAYRHCYNEIENFYSPMFLQSQFYFSFLCEGQAPSASIMKVADKNKIIVKDVKGAEKGKHVLDDRFKRKVVNKVTHLDTEGAQRSREKTMSSESRIDTKAKLVKRRHSMQNSNTGNYHMSLQSSERQNDFGQRIDSDIISKAARSASPIKLDGKEGLLMSKKTEKKPDSHVDKNVGSVATSALEPVNLESTPLFSDFVEEEDNNTNVEREEELSKLSKPVPQKPDLLSGRVVHRKTQSESVISKVHEEVKPPLMRCDTIDEFIERADTNDMATWKVGVNSTQLVKDRASKQYVLYIIDVAVTTETETRKWKVARRYNDFHIVHNVLCRKYGDFDLELPAKKLFGNLDPNFVQQRKNVLNSYICHALSNPILCTSEVLRDFLTPGKGIKIASSTIAASGNSEQVGASNAARAITPHTRRTRPDSSYNRRSRDLLSLNFEELDRERAASQRSSNEIGDKEGQQSALFGLLDSDGDASHSLFGSESGGDGLTGGDESHGLGAQEPGATGNDPSDVWGLSDTIYWAARRLFIKSWKKKWFRYVISFLHFCFGDLFDEWITGMLRDIIAYSFEDHQIIHTCELLTEVLWPKEEPKERTEEEVLKLKITARKALKTMLPVYVQTILGEKEWEDGMGVLVDCLHHDKLNKQLLFVLLDDICVHLFPDVLGSGAGMRKEKRSNSEV